MTVSKFTYLDNLAGSFGIITCDLPYVLSGNQRYECSTMGNWEGDGVCGKFMK